MVRWMKILSAALPVVRRCRVISHRRNFIRHKFIADDYRIVVRFRWRQPICMQGMHGSDPKRVLPASANRCRPIYNI